MGIIKRLSARTRSLAVALNAALALAGGSLAVAAPTSPVETYLVALEAPVIQGTDTDRQAAVTAVLAQASQALSARGFSNTPYKTLPYLKVETADLEGLLATKAVAPIAGVFPVRILSASLAQSLPLIRQPEALAKGASGAGLSVAVLDTGADYRFASLGACEAPGPNCRVAAMYEAASDDGQLDDQTLHGTNVSSIVAGVAPQAKIIAIDVFSPQGARDDDILDGLDWVNANRAAYKITAINLSLGDPTRHYGSDCDRQVVYDQAFRILRAAGVVIVAAAGNEGVKTGIAAPACHSAVIAAGATTDATMPPASWPAAKCRDPELEVDRVTCFSNSGEPLDVLAPGAWILAGVEMAGTSQASPHVAGAVAALRSVRPGLTPDEIAQRMRWTGRPVADRKNNLVRPRLDLIAALEGRLDKPPEAKDDLASAAPGSGVIVPVLANDIDEAPDALSVTSFTQIANGRVVANGRTLLVLVDANATTEQRFSYTVRDEFGRSATAQVRVALKPVIAAPRAVSAGPAISATGLKIAPDALMLLWTEGKDDHVLQCQQSLDANGTPTSNADTCRRLAASGQDIAAASAGQGDYVVAWHQPVIDKQQVLTTIHRFPVFGGAFVASTPNTFGSVEAIGPPAIAAWPNRVVAVWPEWSSIPTFYARAYSNVVSANGGHPIGDRATLIKNFSTPTGHQLAPRADGSYLHLIAKYREWSIMAHDPDGQPLWAKRMVFNPPESEMPGWSLNGLRLAAMADGGFIVAWSETSPSVRLGRVRLQRHTAQGVIQGPIRTLRESAWQVEDLSLSADPTGAAVLAWREDDFVQDVTVIAGVTVSAQGLPTAPVTLDHWSAIGQSRIRDLDVERLANGRRHLLWREGPSGLFVLRAKIVD